MPTRALHRVFVQMCERNQSDRHSMVVERHFLQSNWEKINRLEKKSNRLEKFNRLVAIELELGLRFESTTWSRPADLLGYATLKTSGGTFRAGLFLAFVRLATRAEGPHGGATHCTYGEPNEIKLTAAHGLLDGSWKVRRGAERQDPRRVRLARYAPPAVQLQTDGRQFSFVWSSARTMRRAPTWARGTCRWADEIKTNTHPKNIPLFIVTRCGVPGDDVGARHGQER